MEVGEKGLERLVRHNQTVCISYVYVPLLSVYCFGRGSLTLSLLYSVLLSGSAFVPCVIVCFQERKRREAKR